MEVYCELFLVPFDTFVIYTISRIVGYKMSFNLIDIIYGGEQRNFFVIETPNILDTCYKVLVHILGFAKSSDLNTTCCFTNK